MASNREQRQQEIRFRILRLIEEEPAITTREIANRIGISNGAAYYCLTALVDKGFVKLKNFTQSRKKVNYLYELTPRGIRAKAALTLHFLERKREKSLMILNWKFRGLSWSLVLWRKFLKIEKI